MKIATNRRTIATMLLAAMLALSACTASNDNDGGTTTPGGVTTVPGGVTTTIDLMTTTTAGG